jgi:hypothetical protein
MKQQHSFSKECENIKRKTTQKEISLKDYSKTTDDE